MDKKYIELFNGYKGAYGVADWTHVKIDPKTGKRAPEYRWNYEPFTDQVFIDHLNGAKSVGIQPTNENAQTKFAIIDVDPDKIPGCTYKDYDKKFFIDKIQEFKLPLIPIESKSGGLHLYIFMKEFVSAALLVSFLSNLLTLFKLNPNAEIFPKQTLLSKDIETGELRPGQFVNLPYYRRTERRALNTDGTPFTFEQFIELVEANLVGIDELDKITDGIDKQIYEGTDDNFKDGPPCLAALSTSMKDPEFDGKDRFMYNYHVFVKLKYPDKDTWTRKVKNAPVKYFEEQHANAWDDKFLNAKIRSWTRSEKGYTCKDEVLQKYCKKGICSKKKFGILAGSRGTYPELTNLKKIELAPEPEFEFDVTLADGFSKATVHCHDISYLTEQRKRRNVISRDAHFTPPLIKDDLPILNALWGTLTLVSPPIGTTPKEKLHDVLHAKINGAKAMNDASFKSGTVLIEAGCAFFKYDKFYDRLKSKNWKYSEDKTGTMMTTTYKECGIEFLDQKRFPSKVKGKYNTPTKNVVKISIKEFENVPILHTKLKHQKDII
jgi:hypothetical protein|tara:strand:+ start:1322 stop:2968 length:1647 start_codon:yes stop_codon:yes gene_type:complete